MNNTFSNPNGKIFEIYSEYSPIYETLKNLFFAVFFLAIAIFFLPRDAITMANPLLWIFFLGVFGVSLLFFKEAYIDWNNRNKDTRYIINSKNNTFFVPLSTEIYCQLSDIDTINRRHETVKKRESYYENGKQKYRNVTVTYYYVQIIGENITNDFGFESQGLRDELYSSLTIAVKDVKTFLEKSP